MVGLSFRSLREEMVQYGGSVDHYISCMRKDGIFATSVEIQATAALLKLQISVLDDVNNPRLRMRILDENSTSAQRSVSPFPLCKTLANRHNEKDTLKCNSPPPLFPSSSKIVSLFTS